MIFTLLVLHTKLLISFHLCAMLEGTLNYPISAGYHLKLHVAITFTNIIIFYQLSYIIFFGVHIKYTKCDI